MTDGSARTDAGVADMAYISGGGEAGALMRALDWSQTPFGPPSSWPQSLGSAVSICLGTNFPIAIYWGPDLALLYNDAWSDIPGEKHPWALGRPGREVWPEIWDTIGPLFERVQSTGEGVWQEDQLLPMHRHGYTEECYFNFTFSPIRGENGAVEGIFNAVVETTFRVIEERRERTLRELAEQVATARSEAGVLEIALDCLKAKPEDIPFCLIYRPDRDGLGLRLAGATGLSAPERDLWQATVSAAGRHPALEQAFLRSEPTVLKLRELGIEKPLMSSVWAEPVHEAVVVPVAGGATGASASVYFVCGISPRRAVDPDYQAFIARAAGHIGTAVQNARAYEAERERAAALAEIDRAKTAFFSIVSHEFRTPLTLMLGPIGDLLADGDGLAPANRDCVAIIQRNGQRLLKLVN